MRKLAFLFLILTVAFAWAAGPAATTSASNVTFNKDVAPILNANCAICHRPGEIGPMSLLTYKDARTWGKSIREKVVKHEMPPWNADPTHGKFVNDRRLSDKDVATLVSWVDGGFKEGDAKDLPPARKFVEGWNIGKPDAVIDMGEDYSVPSEGVINYQYKTVTVPFTEDKWVQAAEVRSTNRAVVHHVIVFVQDPPGTQREAGGVVQHIAGQAPRGERGGQWLLIGTAPGDSGNTMNAGTGKLIKAGSKLVFQLHYTPNGTAQKDRTSVGLIFAKHPPQYEVKTIGVQNNRFLIPPGEADYRVESAAEFTEDAVVWSFFPHMHVRGKAFEYTIVYPDGKREVVLNVPKYDFNWQGGFKLATPLEVPKGARLECVAYFDNSKANKYNPDSSKEVKWGDQTWEEMMIGWMDYSVRPAGKSASAITGGTR